MILSRREAERWGGVGWIGRGWGLSSAKTHLVSSNRKSNPNQLKAPGYKVCKWFSFRCHLI